MFKIFKEAGRLRETVNALEREIKSIKRYYENCINDLNSLHKKDINQSHSAGKILADENRDLVRQLELYKAVLSQLSIPVKLPARKQ